MTFKLHAPMLVALFVAQATAALATARVSGEDGTRAHRTRLAAGQQHTCAIVDDGTVQCWGRNNHGQLGDGTLTSRSSPVPVSGLGTALSITAGSFHTCALLSAGTVRCWGFNDSGQLGNGTLTASVTPVAVAGLSNIVSVAAGFLHTCAVRVDGTVWCWGAATANGNTIASAAPLKVNASGAVSVTAGANHSCALIVDGSVKCWGQNTYGQLGYGLDKTTNVPQTVVTSFSYDFDGNLRDVVDVAAGANFTCARHVTGFHSCWGDNSSGQLGTSGSGLTSIKFAVSADLFYDGANPDFAGDEAALATGGAHTCVIRVSGSVFCLGLDDALQLGYALPVKSTAAVPTIANAIEIAAGAKHTCAAIADGTIHCWGDNTYGQHGDGTAGQADIDAVLGISGTFLGRSITVGNQFSCGGRGTGASACWGAGGVGQLGDAASVSSPNPVTVVGLTNAIAVTTGGAHACAIDATGRATCWGDNSHGQLGDGTTTSSSLPVPVQGTLRFVGISAGDAHTCGVTDDGRIFCWGEGGTPDTLAPLEVRLGDILVPFVGHPGIDYVFPAYASGVAAGGHSTCALLTVGTVKCWNMTPAGQLADATGLLNVVAVTVGADHACAVIAFGSVSCWGGNSRGQIGSNSTTPAPTPVDVGLSDAVSVSAGGFYTCAVRAGGGASCWGANDGGELGTKDGGDHLTPTPVAASVIALPTGGTTFIALSNVAEIATSTSPLSPTLQETCALLSSGIVRCWGDNTQGGIGDGTTVDQPRPTAVNSFAANVDPSATLDHDHVAIVTALIDCEADNEAHIFLTVEQNGVTGSATESARCDGALMRVPMRVTVHGRTGFRPGAATADLEAIVQRDREVVDDTHWTRAIVLSVAAPDEQHRR